MTEALDHEAWQAHIQTVARSFAYPPTPDIASVAVDFVRRHQTSRPHHPPSLRISRILPHSDMTLRYVAAGIIVLVAVVFAVPDIRAGVLEFLRIGSVHFLSDDTLATHTPPPPLLPLGAETTLEDASSRVEYPLHLPVQLGPPDHVFLQESPSPIVVMVWSNPFAGAPSISLYMMDSRTVVMKYIHDNPATVTIDGHTGVWLDDQHTLEIVMPGSTPTYEVKGNVLIWDAGSITYRLDGVPTLQDAIAIAESIP